MYEVAHTGSQLSRRSSGMLHRIPIVMYGYHFEHGVPTHVRIKIL